MNKDISPEERLLALIKGKGKKAEKLPSPAQPEKKDTPETRAAKITHLFKAHIPGNGLFDPAVLRHLNKYFAIIAILLLIYLMLEIVFARPYRDVYLSTAGRLDTKTDIPEAPGETVTPPKDYSQYSSVISGKGIFGPAQGDGTSIPREPAASSDASESIGLVGIIAGENPQAIIEDKKNQKTYYLNKGESFDGYTVEEIGDGKVIVEREGNRVALFL